MFDGFSDNPRAARDTSVHYTIAPIDESLWRVEGAGLDYSARFRSIDEALDFVQRDCAPRGATVEISIDGLLISKHFDPVDRASASVPPQATTTRKPEDPTTPRAVFGEIGATVAAVLALAAAVNLLALA